MATPLRDDLLSSQAKAQSNKKVVMALISQVGSYTMYLPKQYTVRTKLQCGSSAEGLKLNPISFRKEYFWPRLNK